MLSEVQLDAQGSFIVEFAAKLAGALKMLTDTGRIHTEQQEGASLCSHPPCTCMCLLGVITQVCQPQHQAKARAGQ